MKKLKTLAARFEVRTWNDKTERWNLKVVDYHGKKSYAEYDTMIGKRYPNSDIELVGGTHYYETDWVIR